MLALFVNFGPIHGDGQSAAIRGLKIAEEAARRHEGFSVDVEKYLYRYRQELRMGTTDCFMVERIPRDPRATRQTLCIGKRDYRPITVRFREEGRTSVESTPPRETTE